MKSRLLFLASLWMAISVALLSALAPLGPPSSRLTGSAFNPATTSVVLKARSPAAATTIRASEADGAGLDLWPHVTIPWMLAATALLVALRFISRSPARPPIWSRAPSHFPTFHKRARAPPVTSKQ